MNEFFQLRKHAYGPMMLQSEVTAALNYIRNKTLGSDGIPIELIKHVGDEEKSFNCSMPNNLDNKKMAKRLEEYRLHSNTETKKMPQNVQITGP